MCPGLWRNVLKPRIGLSCTVLEPRGVVWNDMLWLEVEEWAEMSCLEMTWSREMP